MGAPDKKQRLTSTLASVWGLLTIAKAMARCEQHDFLTYLIEIAEKQCAEETKELRSGDRQAH